MSRRIMLASVVFCSGLAAAQSVGPLTNDAVINMVRDGTENLTIINAIAAADKVDFRFLGPDLQRLVDSGVPDEVFKAMAAKDHGLPIPGATIAKPVQTPSKPPGQRVIPAPKPTAKARPAKEDALSPVPTPTAVTSPQQTAAAPAAKQPEQRTVVLKESASGSKGGKQVKIRGYVTAVKSPSEFEIDDYRITKDSTVTLELEKSEDPDEKTTFTADEVRVGTEMEIRGELDQATNQLTARTIKINLDEHLRVKRTALLEVVPDLKRVGSVWEGQIHIDGQRVVISESTAVTIKPNNSQKKAAKKALKSAKKEGQAPKTSNAEIEEDDEEPGVALNRTDQIRGNTFVSYEGTRQKDGTILAKKVEFTENELTSNEARLWKMLTPKVKQPSLTGGKPGELNIQQVGKFKIVANPEVQKYVQDLGASLVPKFQRDLPSEDPQKIHFQFFVVEQKVPNAFALANGTVVVHSAMMTMLENEAQFAAVLSHEISHATEEHTYRQSQYHKKLRIAIAIGGAVGAAYGGRAVADLTNLTLAAMRNGYQRSLENQADRVGMEYMVNAGYDPREAARVWKVMAMKLGDAPTNFFYSDHDNDTTRRSYLMAELKNNYANADFASYKHNSDQFTATVSTLNGLYTPKGKKSKVATVR